VCGRPSSPVRSCHNATTRAERGRRWSYARRDADGEAASRRGSAGARHGAKLRQLQALGGRVYACGPSLAHFHVDSSRLALEDVVVCEYLCFMEVMRLADVQLYT
jgi:hypothetical protein